MLTPKERLAAYEYAREKVVNEGNSGICEYLDYWLLLNRRGLWIPYIYRSELFPEFISKRPIGKGDKDMWFDVNESGNLQRIALLDECINEVKLKI